MGVTALNLWVCFLILFYWSAINLALEALCIQACVHILKEICLLLDAQSLLKMCLSFLVSFNIFS